MSDQSTTLLFRLSHEDSMRHLVRELSSVLHVVPAALADTAGHALSVEIEAGWTDLHDEVRAIVTASDPAAEELHQQANA